MPDAYLETVIRMEPNIAPVDESPVLTSIAISLKRIADTLERANLNGDLFANAIQDATYRGLAKGN